MKLLFSVFSVFLISVALSFSGCSSQPDYPPINYSASKDYNFGQVVWRDLVSPNPKLASQFYKDVFGWTSTQTGSSDNPYWIFKSNGKPVGGMYQMSESKKNAGGEWVPYFSVNSLNDFIAKSKTAGGNVIVKPTELPGRGIVALLTDPQNAYFAIIKSMNGDPPYMQPPENNFLWSEQWANDMNKSADYYKNILNLKSEVKKDDNRDYILMQNNDKLCVGIIQNPVENVRTHWIQYVRVNDVKATEQKAKDAGAKILIPCDSTIRNGSVTVFADPTGAPIAAQKWPNK